MPKGPPTAQPAPWRAVKPSELGAGLDAGPQHPGLITAEYTQTAHSQLEDVHLDSAEEISEFRCRTIVDVSGKSQCQMQIVGLNPAGARERLLGLGKISGDLRRNGDRCKQP